MKISICIPTFNRADLLKVCLESCFNQSLAPYEILIGDDSPGDETSELVQSLMDKSPCPVRYFHNRPALKQSANVHHLLQEASGDFISIMHDDDLYEKSALEILSKCFATSEVMVSYGKQKIIDNDGLYDHASTLALNNDFCRESSYSGIQEDFLTSALIQQFPNNGFLIRSNLAKSVGYLEPERLMGDACDYAFAILCARQEPFGKSYFVDEYTGFYRLSNQSIIRNNPTNNAAFLAYEYVSSLERNITEKPLVSKWLEEKSSHAISQASKLGLYQTALSWYFSEWHTSKRYTLGGIKRLLAIGLSSIKSSF
jgi:glycosyltransferase involved in cell wall biosynthesis